MILSLKLENWKTHLDTRINFEKGTNIVVGKMGAGKSSILDAISFALFGTFPSAQSKRVRLEDMIMEKPEEKNRARVKLVFKYNNEKYEIEREIARGKSQEARLSKNGTILAFKPREVNEEVSKILEIDYNLFSRAVYSEQNEIDFFLKLTPKERREKVDDLLNIKLYEEVRLNGNTLRNRLRMMFEDRKDILEKMEREFKQKDLETLQKRREEVRLEGRKLMKDKEELMALIKRREKELREGEEKLGKLKKEVERYEELKKKLLTLETKISLLSGEKPEEVKEEEVKTTREKLNKIREKLENKESILGEKIGLMKNLEEGFSKIKSIEGKCPVCERPFRKEDREKHLKEVREKINVLEKEIDVLRKERKTHKEKLGVLESELREKERNFERWKEYLEKKKKQERLIGEKQQTEKNLKDIRVDEKAFLKANENLIKNSEEVKRLKERVFSMERERNRVAELLSGIEKEISIFKKIEEDIRERRTELTEINYGLSQLDYFVNALLEVQEEMRHILIGSINNALEDVWRQLYPYADYTNVKIFVEEDGYLIKVYEEGAKEWKTVERLSGGERSSLALALRIVFALVLARNLSWLILDEPTHNLDDAAVEKMKEIFREKLPEFIDQIFIVTHDERLKDTGRVFFFERDKEKDGFTEIQVFE